MKKTLLSMLAGVALIGSAFAVPGPDDRRALCESKPLDFVWVEKTQACVPVNPCTSNNKEIREAYCIPVRANADERMAKLAVERYAKNVMGATIKEFKPFDDKDMVYMGIYTTDGGYYVAAFRKYQPKSISSDMTIDEKNITLQINRAKLNAISALGCWAYGKEPNYTDKWAGCLGVTDAAQCEDIADFTSLLIESVVEGRIEQMGVKVCWLTAPDAQ